VGQARHELGREARNAGMGAQKVSSETGSRRNGGHSEHRARAPRGAAALGTGLARPEVKALPSDADAVSFRLTSTECRLMSK
jgi:hypothetical protein